MVVPAKDADATATTAHKVKVSFFIIVAPVWFG